MRWPDNNSKQVLKYGVRKTSIAYCKIQHSSSTTKETEKVC